MRNGYLIMVCPIVVALSISTIYAQNNQAELPIGNYVVVGAYLPGDETYLEKFVKTLLAKGLDPKSGFESKRNFYYVFLDVYSDFAESIIQMQKARQNPEFATAWVRVIKDGRASPLVSSVAKENPTPVQIVPIKTETTAAVNPEKFVVTTMEPIIIKDTAMVEPPVDNPKPAPIFIPVSLNNLDVFLSVHDAQKDKTISSEIEVVDTERARLMEKIKANEYLNLRDPKSKSGQLTLICNVFGYRREQREISFPVPTDEQAEMVGNFYMVKFDLIRLQKGDISVLYNVFFYNDAAIMLPESKYELNQLMSLLQDNPAIKIVLHGHTNGNALGKIVTMGISKDFFSLTKDVKTGSGSSKELSNQRAIVIREWLLANGVAADRVTVKPWGGKRMLHDKNSVHAKKNIRVEVEVVED